MWDTIERVGTVAACAFAALVCLIVAPNLILISLYGFDVIEKGVPPPPPALERGPGYGMLDGLFMLLEIPLALVLWIATVVIIRRVAPHLRNRAESHFNSRHAA